MLPNTAGIAVIVGRLAAVFGNIGDIAQAVLSKPILLARAATLLLNHANQLACLTTIEMRDSRRACLRVFGQRIHRELTVAVFCPEGVAITTSAWLSAGLLRTFGKATTKIIILGIKIVISTLTIFI